MKSFLIAFSFLCAGVLMKSAEATELVLTTNDWFDVSTSVTNGGEMTVATSAKCDVITGDKFKIASDIDHRVTFQATDALTEKMANVTLNLEAAIVPNGSLVNLTGGDKVAFALYQDTDAAVYKAWLNGAWVTLSGPAVPEEKTPYTLLMEFDNREANKKVRFTVTMIGGPATVLKGASEAEWLTYATDAIQRNVDFVGNGNVVDFEGERLTIIAEIVVVDGGKIRINEADMEKFRAAMPYLENEYDTVDEFIADAAQTAFGSDNFKTAGVPVGAAYALGLVADDGTGKMAPVEEGVLKARAVATAGDTEGIKLGLNVAAIPDLEDTGATISYQVVDEKNSAVTEGLVIPKEKLAAGLKIFTVRAIVSPAKPQKED